MTPTAIIGIAAALFSIAAFVPQAYKIFKTRQTKDLSLPMWVLQVIAFSTWITYGVTSRQWPIIVANVVCLLLSCFILAMKLFG
ncbi:MAG TPA: SemiSWEET transporter [Kofleriaceae bacterium]|jgi:MtN3 and saliva related transmembrane protein